MQSVSPLKVLLLGVVMVFVTACGSTGGTKGDDMGASAGNDGRAETFSMEEEARLQAQKMEEERQAHIQSEQDALLGTTTFYFDFDQTVVRQDSRSALEAHAKNLSASGGRVVLEGHADERGTREYNLALGERRAEAIVRYLAVLGVSKTQIEAVSYGEERPASIGHSESSWGLNRRVELRYEN